MANVTSFFSNVFGIGSNNGTAGGSFVKDPSQLVENRPTSEKKTPQPKPARDEATISSEARESETGSSLPNLGWVESLGQNAQQYAEKTIHEIKQQDLIDRTAANRR